MISVFRPAPRVHRDPHHPHMTNLMFARVCLDGTFIWIGRRLKDGVEVEWNIPFEPSEVKLGHEFPKESDIFGLIGTHDLFCSRIYHHAAHHFARMQP